MSYSVKIIADSVNPVGCRLTTFELTYPRFVHAELMTHRMFSRNSASSRAIPVEKMIERVKDDPVMPLFWGKNQRGMQAAEELSGDALISAKEVWLQARYDAITNARLLLEAGAHKQLVNRFLEPWMFITVIVSATEYENWFHLRDSEFAQPEIAWVAREMRKALSLSAPIDLFARQREWHLPYVELDDDHHPLYVSWKDVDVALRGSPAYWSTMRKISTARCARVSYLTHDGERDYEEDIRLHDQLAQNGHWSPFEHVAQCLETDERSGNFFGWRQYRKLFETENAGRRMP